MLFLHVRVEFKLVVLNGRRDLSDCYPDVTALLPFIKGLAVT